MPSPERASVPGLKRTEEGLKKTIDNTLAETHASIAGTNTLTGRVCRGSTIEPLGLTPDMRLPATGTQPVWCLWLVLRAGPVAGIFLPSLPLLCPQGKTELHMQNVPRPWLRTSVIPLRDSEYTTRETRNQICDRIRWNSQREEKRNGHEAVRLSRRSNGYA